MRRSEGSVTGVDGLRLAYRAWEAKSPHAGIVVLHGLGEHSGRYEQFAEALATFAISTYALDQRGHGLSDGRRGHVPTFDVFLREFDRFRREVEGLAEYRLPLFVLGQSMGGLIALRYVEEYESHFLGAVVCSPWLATSMPVPRWKIMAANALNRVLPAWPFRSDMDPEDFTHDLDIVQAYRADPLVHGVITPRLFVEVSTAMGLVLQRSDRIREPLLFLLGGDDRLVDTERTVRLAQSMSSADVTVRVFPKLYHELLQEVERPRIFREISDWIHLRLQRDSNGADRATSG
jgi:alpha-beta hydrolase superfamily lysophospholipase